MATEVASQHPIETWQALTAALAGVVALVGVLYNRLNKDVDEGEKKQEECQKQVDSRINSIAISVEGIGTNLSATMQDVEEIFRKLTTGAESFSNLRADLRELETRIEGIMRELEQKAGAHQEASAELRRLYAELKQQIERVERGCIVRHRVEVSP